MSHRLLIATDQSRQTLLKLAVRALALGIDAYASLDADEYWGKLFPSADGSGSMTLSESTRVST